jgi:phage baseplate assembly protein W
VPINPRNINPNDLNRNQAIGVAFPLLSDGEFTQTYLMKDQVKANIINVLLTERGERVNQPTFGVGLKSLLFEQHVNVTGLQPEIERQLEIYVPDIELYEVNGDFDSNNHTLKITLVYSVIGSSDLDAIEINVDADETKYVSFDYKKSVGGY